MDALQKQAFPLQSKGRKFNILFKIGLALITGILLTASFPPGRLSFLAWFALVPLLFSIEGDSPFTAFKFGFLAGLAHYTTLIYWISNVLAHYGNLGFPISAGPYLLLSLYLALYPACFAAIAARLRHSTLALLWIPAVWTSLEYIRSFLLTGFPWCLLGYTQYRNLHLIQSADICGVYGLTFLILLVNTLIYHLASRGRQSGKKVLKWEVGFAALLFAVVFSYGSYRLSEHDKSTEDKGKRVLIVQGNIDQSLKWNPKYKRKTLELYLSLTRSAGQFKPQLIVWPETAVPFFFQNKGPLASHIYTLAGETGASIVFGSPAYKKQPMTDPRGIEVTTRYFNRAYLVTPDAETSHYDKVHLVPFGEYVPLKDLFFFLEKLVTAAGNFEPGENISPLKTGKVSAGILICFEAIFPDIARTHTTKGANVLINLTNDAWFGRTSAPHQHLCMSVFRAVENRRTLIRAANTGISAFIGPWGEIISSSKLFEKAIMKGRVRPAKNELTFYTRYGDFFVLALLLVSLLRLLPIFTAIVLNKAKAGAKIKKRS